MKQSLKLLVGLLIALVSIGVICVLALRYLDVLLKPVAAVRSAINRRKDEIGDDCFCDCEECFDEEEA